MLENITLPTLNFTVSVANSTGLSLLDTMNCDYKSTNTTCFDCYRQKESAMEAPFCPMQSDKVICWPPTAPNTRVEVPCPRLAGLIWENSAYRYCGPTGRWQDKSGGYTLKPYGDYQACYSEVAMKIYNKFMANKTREEKEFIKNIIDIFRKMELTGLCISLVTTIISLFIFCYFRNLKCHRTRIHKNLFLALIVQIAMRIILYVDQFVAREMGGDVAGAASGESDTIYDTPVFCEILYCLLEYTKTVKFMWMFIEGLYLHNMIAISVFSGKPNYVFYYIFAWAFPLTLTTVWAIPMAINYKMHCWFGYYFDDLIWILEGPRTAVMVVNLLFLLNIIRVLVMKLRDPKTNEANRVRKAVKAAIVLLPLLGLTNFVIMLEPDGSDINKLVVYTFSSSFLIMSEGFFISLLYCFLNGEVRQIIRRQWERYHQHRLIHNSSLRKMSRSFSIFTSFTEVSQNTTSVAAAKKSTGGACAATSRSINDTTSRPSPGFLNIFKKKSGRKRSLQESVSLGVVTGYDPPPSYNDVEPSSGGCRSDIVIEENV